jgi:hypothetical protein
MLGEIEQAWFRRGDALAQPYEVRRPHWDMLFGLLELARSEMLLLSSDQLSEARSDAAVRGGRFNLRDELVVMIEQVGRAYPQRGRSTAITACMSCMPSRRTFRFPMRCWRTIA